MKSLAFPLIIRTFLWFVPLTVVAQDTPKFELFGGYSYLHTGERFRSGIQQGNDLHGWQSSLKWNWKPRFGVVAEAAGNYGNQRGIIYGLVDFANYKADYQQHTFLFGPEFRISPDDGRWTVNVRALGGFAHSGELKIPVPPGTIGLPNVPLLRLEHAGYVAAASAGGSLDVRINRRFSVRVAQPEVLLTRIGNTIHSDVRVSTGLVIHFGSR